MKLIDERPQWMIDRIAQFLRESSVYDGNFEERCLLEEARDTLAALLARPEIRELLGYEKGA